MKTRIIKNLLIVITGFFITQIIMSYKCNTKPIRTNQSVLQNQDSTIIGTWVSEKDSNWKLVFESDNKCKWYYTNEPTISYNYIISNSSPQCGVTVPVDNYTNYLQLINLGDTTDKVCYLLNGITNTHLSLSVIDRGGAFVFNRQP